jgi:hypothetical protein
MDERAKRIGLNEALFREVNERVRSVNVDFGATGGDGQFVCECGDDRCTEPIRVSLTEYERIRSDPALFFVRPGHQIPEVETAVEESEEYLVVRKHQGDPADLAESTDPRP